MLVLLFVFTLSYLVLASEYPDPITNFCRRIGHSSTLKNQKLYINGGIATFAYLDRSGKPDNTTVTIGATERILRINASTSFNANAGVPIDTIWKGNTASISGYPMPPDLKHTALFSGPENSSKLWMYGGTNSGFNTTFSNYYMAPSPQYGLWNWDSRSNTWTAFDTMVQGLTIPSWGASAEIPEQHLGFYLGGQVDNGTASTTSNLDPPVHLGGMVVVDTQDGAIWNMSGIPPQFQSNRQGAKMIYISEFGTAGVLVLIGGVSNGKPISMSTITILDVATLRSDQPTTSTSTTNTWWSVNATGEMPEPRTDFCLVYATAQDNSSVNIYLYGGRMGGTPYDDVYVLSLPSFTWKNVFRGVSARWGMTCHFFAPRHMIQVGGGGPIGDNLTGDCDWEYDSRGLGFLDLSKVENSTGWSQEFTVDAEPYEVPMDVVRVIGGNGIGNATVTAPSRGWQTPGLRELFTITSPSSTSSQGTSASSEGSKPKDTLPVSATVGISLGSAIFLLAGLTGAYILVSKKRRQKRTAKNAGGITEMGQDEYKPRELQNETDSRCEVQDTHMSEADGHVVCEISVEAEKRDTSARTQQSHQQTHELAT